MWSRLLVFLVLVQYSSCLDHTEILKYKNKTKEMFFHGLFGYLKYAFPADELLPLSCAPLRPSSEVYGQIDWNINDVLGNYILTLVDSMDTIAVIGEKDLFHKVANLVIEKLPNFDIDSRVQVFEVNIRMLGGLLSSHGFLIDKKSEMYMPGYKNQLLKLAKDLADRLLPAFTKSPSGLPYSRVNLRHGVLPWEANSTNTAAIGTLLLEFGTLSRYLNDSTYENYAKNALKTLWDLRSPIGLFGSRINIVTKKWENTASGIGAEIDSIFEYLLKAYILFGDDSYYEMFEEANQAVLSNLRDKQKSYIYLVGDMSGIGVKSRFVDSLTNFWPGMQVLNGDLDLAIPHHQFLFSIWRKFGASPETFQVDTKQAASLAYPLRPELIESTWYLYQSTRNPYYLEVAASMLNDLDELTRTRCGFATVSNLQNRQLKDRMESFFLAETLKYFYLIFDTENQLNKLDVHFVFSTEAHILRINPATWNSKPSKITRKCQKRDQSAQNQVFNQRNPAHLPLNTSLINEIYSTTGLSTKQDWFYNNIILPIEHRMFNPIGLFREICSFRTFNSTLDAANSVIPVVSVQMGGTPNNFKIIDVKFGAYISSLEGKKLELTPVTILNQSFYSVSKVDSVAIPQGNYVVLPKSAIKLHNDTIETVEIIHLRAGKLFFAHGYLSLFGPLIDLGQHLSGQVAPVIQNNQLSNGCDFYDSKTEKSVFGKIAIVSRGNCTFGQKAVVAALSNAKALLIVNTKNELMYMAKSQDTEHLRIPVVALTLEIGKHLVDSCKNQIPCETKITLYGGGSFILSSSLMQVDGKYISNAYAINPKKKRKWWNTRGSTRFGVLDAGQDISCLFNCNLHKDTCCHSVGKL